MSPFASLLTEFTRQHALVRRQTFIRILRRISELSGIRLTPVDRATETPTGVSYRLKDAAPEKPWGVSFVASGIVKVGAGPVMIEGKGGCEILESAALSVGEVGFVGIAATVSFPVQGEDVATYQVAKWVGWTEVTSGPELAFVSAPPSDFIQVNHQTSESNPCDVFIPLAYVENGRVKDLIRDGVTLRLAPQSSIKQPLFYPVLT